MDLHLHTPASTDYQQAGVTYLDILRKAEERGVDIIAFTDHNSVRGYADLWREIEDLELLEYVNRMSPAESERLAEFRRLLAKILLLPGFEFTATFGFHILAIFPETTSIRMMEHLLLYLGVPEDRFGSGEVGSTSDVLHVYEVLDEHGALVIGAHVNSSHGVAMQGIRFGGQTKIAYTQDPHLHALEVTDLGSTSRRATSYFFSGIKPEYPRRMHCIQGSDAHRLDRDPARETSLGIGDRATEVLLPEASFQALKELFAGNHFDRIRPARPGGPSADALHSARDTGNTASQAFHERISQAKTGNVAILRDIVGMANGAGGMIYLGVGAADRRTVPGVPDAQSAIDGLVAEVQSQITPPIETSTETINYGGKSVVALQVPEGSEKPYAVLPASIFVRRGSETHIATRNEIVEMIRGIPDAPRTAATAVTSPIVHVPTTPEPVVQRREDAPAPLIETAIEAPTEPANGEGTWSDPVAPRTGAEIITVTERDGTTTYSIRDLRNGQVANNVTRESARRLWQYAIQQFEQHPVDEGHVRWKGEFGFWKVYRPARGERRFNLVHRGANGIRIFYGVTEDGLDDRWTAVIPAPRVATQ